MFHGMLTNHVRQTIFDEPHEVLNIERVLTMMLPPNEGAGGKSYRNFSLIQVSMYISILKIGGGK